MTRILLTHHTIVAVIGILASAIWPDVVGAGTAAEKCRDKIGKEAGKHLAATTKTLAKCNDALLKGKSGYNGELGRGCRDLAGGTQAKLDKARAKFLAAIDKACGGGDRVCGTADDLDIDDPAIGWGPAGAFGDGVTGVCPGFRSVGCTNAITHCGGAGSDGEGISDCVLCLTGETAGENIDVLYADLDAAKFGASSDPEKTVNKCQQVLVRAGAKHVLSKSKILRKCWVALDKGKPGFSSVDAAGCVDSSGKTAAKIDKSEAKKIATICKACGGDDKLCDQSISTALGTLANTGTGSGDDFDPLTDIGFDTACPDVTLPYPPNTNCADLDNLGSGASDDVIENMEEFVGCIGCVLEFTVDCADRAIVPHREGMPEVCKPPLPIAISPGSGAASFEQIDFRFAAATQVDSPVGRVLLDVSSLLDAAGAAVAFANVSTAAGWVVQNAPLSDELLPDYPVVEARLDLGVAAGVDVTVMDALVTMSAVPLGTAPGGTPERFPVGSTPYDAGGVEAETTEPPAPPETGPSFPVLSTLFQFKVQPGHQNVQTATAQCAPAAVANSLQWLEDQYNRMPTRTPTPVAPTPTATGPTSTVATVTPSCTPSVTPTGVTPTPTPVATSSPVPIVVPHDHVPGLRGDPPNSLVGQLDVSMRRGDCTTTRTHGPPLGTGSIFAGTLTYLSASGLGAALAVKHQGTFGEQDQLFAGVKSIARGKVVTPEFILQEISDGENVTAIIHYRNPAGDVVFGHAVDIVAAGKVAGRPFVMYVSDHVQSRADGFDGTDDDQGTDTTDFSWLDPQPGGAPPKMPNEGRAEIVFVLSKSPLE